MRILRDDIICDHYLCNMELVMHKQIIICSKTFELIGATSETALQKASAWISYVTKNHRSQEKLKHYRLTSCLIFKQIFQNFLISAEMYSSSYGHLFNAFPIQNVIHEYSCKYKREVEIKLYNCTFFKYI